MLGAVAWVAAGQAGRAIVQVRDCAGEIDRCLTCHPKWGADVTDDPLHRSHPFGCAICHGGNGRAVTQEAAHAGDPMHRSPHIQASCPRCHVPGDAPGMERLLRGIDLYLALGCQMCHPLTVEGKGGWDFGPDLLAAGRRSLQYLEQSLLDPAANFPQSTMPTFRPTFAQDREALDDLLIFLESLSLSGVEPRCDLRGQSQRLVNSPCEACHDGPGGKASGRFEHRCTYILKRKAELACTGCHAQGVPAARGVRGAAPFGATAGSAGCPVIAEHRRNCDACHAAGGQVP